MPRNIQLVDPAGDYADDPGFIQTKDAAAQKRHNERVLRETMEREIANTPGGIDQIPQPPMMAGDSGGPRGELMRTIMAAAPVRTTGEFGLDSAPAGGVAQASEASGPRGMLMKAILAAKAKEAPADDFDPDAFLASGTPKTPPADDFDPDAFVAGDHAQAAPEKRDAPGWWSTALRNAGHIPGVDQVAGALGAIENQDTLHRAMPYLIPFDKDAREAAFHDYRFIRDRSREDREAGDEAHPSAKWAGIGAQTALSLGLPVGAAANAATKLSIGQRLLNASRVGAAFGGASGLLDGDADLTRGEGTKALEQAAGGAASGALLGGAVQGLGEGVSAVAAKAAPAVEGVANRLFARAAGFKKRDIDLATQGGRSAAERLGEIGKQISDENGVRALDTPEKIAERLRGIREKIGAEKGAAVDALDAARPVSGPSLNRLGADIPAATSVVAGRDVPAAEAAVGDSMGSLDAAGLRPTPERWIEPRKSARASPFGIDPNLGAQQPEPAVGALTRRAPPEAVVGVFHKPTGEVEHPLSFVNPSDGRTYDMVVSHNPATKSLQIETVQPHGARDLLSAHGDVANTVGPRTVRDVAGDLKTMFPDAERIGGFRVTGANPNRDMSVPLKAPKPRGLASMSREEINAHLAAIQEQEVAAREAATPQNVMHIPTESEPLRSAPTPKAPPTLLSRKALASEIEDHADSLARNPGANAFADNLRKLAGEVRDTPGNDQFTFREWEALKARYGKSFNKLGENEMNEARKTVSGIAKRRAEQEAENVSPELAAKFKEAKQRFANLKPAEKAAQGQEKRDFANQLAGITKVGVPLVALEKLATGQPLQAAAALASPLVYRALEARAPSTAAVGARSLARALQRAKTFNTRLALPAGTAAEELSPLFGFHLPSLSPEMAKKDDPDGKALLAALRAQ